MYGRIALTVVTKIEGQTAELSLNGQESVGYAAFGGRQCFSMHYS
jgi:hypothetical protein